MLISASIRLFFVLLITIFLVKKSETKHIDHFSQQTWSVKETLPFYWALIILSLIAFFLFKIISNYLLHQVLAFSISFFAAFLLFFLIRRLIFRRKLSITVTGLKRSQVFWFIIFLGIQYTILITLFWGKSNVYALIWLLTYLSVDLIIWPVTEEMFFLGMVFIPTSRKVGLIPAAIVVSLLQFLYHFDFNTTALIIAFMIWGLLKCYLYLKTKGILIPLLLHSLLNFFATLRDLHFISI